MARDEADREDLMAEATALRERIELTLPGEEGPVVSGFRDDGRFSVYFGSDPVFHFDADGGLRRAFVNGDLYRSQRHTLARLTRTRTGTEVALVRHDLEPGELEDFLVRMEQRLAGLQSALEQDTARVVRQVPAEVDLRPRLVHALADARKRRLSAVVRKK